MDQLPHRIPWPATCSWSTASTTRADGWIEQCSSLPRHVEKPPGMRMRTGHLTMWETRKSAKMPHLSHCTTKRPFGSKPLFRRKSRKRKKNPPKKGEHGYLPSSSSRRGSHFCGSTFSMRKFFHPKGSFSHGRTHFYKSFVRPQVQYLFCSGSRHEFSRCAH